MKKEIVDDDDYGTVSCKAPFDPFKWYINNVSAVLSIIDIGCTAVLITGFHLLYLRLF